MKLEGSSITELHDLLDTVVAGHDELLLKVKNSQLTIDRLVMKMWNRWDNKQWNHRYLNHDRA